MNVRRANNSTNQCIHGFDAEHCLHCKCAVLQHELAVARSAAAVNKEAADKYRQIVADLRTAIVIHHAQKADDRCIEDDDRLYAAAGLPPCDRRVGDKFAMLRNCARFIENRCQGGGWPSYVELERQISQLLTDKAVLENGLRDGQNKIKDALAVLRDIAQLANFVVLVPFCGNSVLGKIRAAAQAAISQLSPPPEAGVEKPS